MPIQKNAHIENCPQTLLPTRKLPTENCLDRFFTPENGSMPIFRKNYSAVFEKKFTKKETIIAPLKYKIYL